MPAPPAGPPPPKPFTLGKVLWVEGKTEVNFFTALCRHLGVADTIDIRDFGGTSKLRAGLRTLAAASGFRSSVRSLGVIRDAEADPQAAASAIAEAVKAAGFATELQVRTFVIPDAKTPGNIETLCLRSVADRPLFGCVHDFVRATTAVGIEWPRDHMRDKGLVQAYLAAGPEPQHHAGTASYKGAWPWASPTFNELIEFIQAL